MSKHARLIGPPHRGTLYLASFNGFREIIGWSIPAAFVVWLAAVLGFSAKSPEEWRWAVAIEGAIAFSLWGMNRNLTDVLRPDFAMLPDRLELRQFRIGYACGTALGLVCVVLGQCAIVRGTRSLAGSILLITLTYYAIRRLLAPRVIRRCNAQRAREIRVVDDVILLPDDHVRSNPPT